MNETDQSKFTEKYFQSSHGKLHYFDSNGEGEQLHFLHANGMCAGTYLPMLNKLDDKYHVFASDVRGHGDSEFPGNERIKHWSLFAEDLKEFIENNMNPPIKGVGHSLGAVTSYIAAAKYPHLFSSLVLIDPVVMETKFLFMTFILKLIGKQGIIPIAKNARRRKSDFINKGEAKNRYSGYGMFKTWPEEYVDAFINYGIRENGSKNAELKCTPEIEAQIYESVPVNVWSYAKKIECPVLLIQGANSDTFLPKAANNLNKRIKNCRLRVVENSSHFVPMEESDECVDEMRMFYEEIGYIG